MATVQILQVVPPGGQAFAWYNSAPQDGRGKLEAEHYDEKRGMIIEASEAGGDQLGAVTNDAWARYEHVDFGTAAPTSMQARASVDVVAGGHVELRIDRRDGPVIGALELTSTGSWTTYGDFNAQLVATTGAQDVYLAFKADAGKTHVANLNWITLR